LAAIPNLVAANVGLTVDNAAYVIYTSGSTGQPKGVTATHQGICNLAVAQGRAFAVESSSRVLQFASIGFDASVSEIFMAFGTGAALCLPSRGALPAGQALVDVIARAGITHVTLPSGVLAGLSEPGTLDSVGAMVVAGDVLPTSLAMQWRAPWRRVLNAYGPTEGTVCATVYECRGDEAGERSIPIGRPIANTRVYVLDAAGAPVPVGVAGELYIGGTGVTRGYHERPALTAARFVPDPFGPTPGARLYRTGDRVRWRADGTVDFLGRSDTQVKVRGYRIELGEIEAVLGTHPGVGTAVVVAREDAPGDKRLVAYYVPASEAGTDAEALRTYLTERLPSYMVPAAYVGLPALPLTANGKADRKALPAPASGAYATRAYEAPAGAVEETVAELWAEVLHVERVGRADDFFALGGHSLLVVTLIERMRQRGLHADVKALFTTPTLGAFAAALRTAPREVPVPPNGIPLDATRITPEMLTLWR
jgi:amino acid adenylation domain-containing protein